MIRKVTPDVFFGHHVPERTDTYVPVTNKQIEELVRKAAGAFDYTITGFGYRSNASNNEFVGMYSLNSPENGLSKMIGFRNSINKKYSVGFVAGALVMICSNGVISGDIITFRKHTGNVHNDLEVMVKKAFEEITPRFTEVSTDISLMKSRLITVSRALSVLGELFFSERLLNVTQMSVVKETLYTDKNFAIPKSPLVYTSVWNLYNIITNALKHGAPSDYFTTHIQLHNYIKSNLLNDEG